MFSVGKDHNPGLYREDVDLSDFPSGIYMIKITAGEKINTAKIIKQK